MTGYAGRAGGFPFEVDDEGLALRQCRTLLDAAGDGLYQLDAGGRIVAVGDGLTELTGFAREDLLGRPAAEFLREVDVSTAESTIRAMLENDLETATLEVELERADGEPVSTRVRLSPLVSDGEFRGTVGLVRDVSAERAAEATSSLGGSDALGGESEEVFERIDDAFYALDDRFRFTYVNERAEELLEASEAELLGENIWEQYPAATETDIWDALHEALETQEPTSFETYTTNRCRSGRRRASTPPRVGCRCTSGTSPAGRSASATSRNPNSATERSRSTSRTAS
jgi:PAS domain S-box-containing protein